MTDGDHEEILRLRERVHELSNQMMVSLGNIQTDVALLKREIAEARADSRREIEELRADNQSLRRGVYTLAFSAVSAAIVAVLSLGVSH